MSKQNTSLVSIFLLLLMSVESRATVLYVRFSAREIIIGADSKRTAETGATVCVCKITKIGDTFVARMDSKADRKQHVLTIHNLHFESLKLSKPMVAKICDAIKTFAKFNQCEVINIKKSNDKSLLKVIQKAVGE